jgi:hypothetical protein
MKKKKKIFFTKNVFSKKSIFAVQKVGFKNNFFFFSDFVSSVFFLKNKNKKPLIFSTNHETGVVNNSSVFERFIWKKLQC